MFNVVLVEPEIPQNSGSILRLCACTGCRLWLVEPLGYSLDDSLGRESRGLPEPLLAAYREQGLRIPMPGRTRSLNLAASAAVAVYEGLRQLSGWPGPDPA